MARRPRTGVWWTRSPGRRSSPTTVRDACAAAGGEERPAGSGQGVALPPLERVVEADALRYPRVTVRIDRARAPPVSRSRGPAGAQPSDIAGIEAAGAAWYPLALARELEDAILWMRTNELEIGTWLIRTEGDAAAVLAMDAVLLANREHWLVRETIGYLRRTFSRLDVSSRSLFALIEAGSCFAGTLFELALACDRIYHLALPNDAAQAPKISAGETNFGVYPMVTGESRLQRRFYSEAPALEAVRATVGQPARRRRGLCVGPGDQQS